jgi:hypothetical protein
MDPARADSDGDGLPDDRDATPRHAPSADESTDEDAAVLRRAFFAVYGLTGSRSSIFVRPELRPIQLYGLAGPVFFGVDLPARTGCGRAGCPPTRGAEVTWRFMQRSATDVTLEFTTWQGFSFWSRTRTRLRKIGREWIVVECALSSIT